MLVRPRVLDLFCGCGGLSLGFRLAGFDVALAVDTYEEALEVYSKNFPNSEIANADLAETDASELFARVNLEPENVDVVVGGPPCQGFSLMGNRDMDDDRNELLLRFAEYVVDVEPDYFVMENVKGLVTGETTAFLASFEDTVTRAGYEIVSPIRCIDATDYGIPQRRERIIVIGHDEEVPAPDYPAELDEEVDVGDAIGDIPAVLTDEEIADGVYSGPLGERSEYVKEINSCPSFAESVADGLTEMEPVNHTTDVRNRFDEVQPGGVDDVSGFKRLEYDEPANTLRAGSSRDKGTHTPARPIHPEAPRAITVREAARLQTFPDWFQFHGTKYHGLRQIGNSVPPKVAKLIAEEMFEVITDKEAAMPIGSR